MTSISKQPDNLITERMQFHALIQDVRMPYAIGINGAIVKALPDIDVRNIGRMLRRVVRSMQYVDVMRLQALLMLQALPLFVVRHCPRCV